METENQMLRLARSLDSFLPLEKMITDFFSYLGDSKTTYAYNTELDEMEIVSFVSHGPFEKEQTLINWFMYDSKYDFNYLTIMLRVKISDINDITSNMRLRLIYDTTLKLIDVDAYKVTI